MPAPQKTVTKPKPPKVEEAKSFLDEVIDPLVAMYDVVTGAVFDGPKAVADETDTKEDDNAGLRTGSTKENDDGKSKREYQPPSVVTVNLGDLFRSSKRNSGGSVTPPTPKAKGPPPGNEEPDDADE